VLVDFPDKKMGNGKAQYFDNLFFGPSGSVDEYYREVSSGKVSFSGEVIGPFTLPRKMTEYANGDSGTTEAEPNSQTMARDTVKAVKAANYDLSPYDNNGNGLVDAFVIVHAGSGAEIGGDKNKLWSLQWFIDRDPISVSSTVGVYSFLSIPEDALLGVTVHEIGHLVFSWPDLYDGDTVPTQGLGPWCLMAGGSWLGTPAGSKPCHPSAWCKATQGWVSVISHSENGTLRLPDVKDSREVHRLWTNGDMTSPEYFLLENRQKKKFDAQLPGSGLFSRQYLIQCFVLKNIC